MKKFLSLILLTLILTISSSGLIACTDNNKDEDWAKIFIVEYDTVIGITEYGKTLTEITIPDDIGGVTVTTIGAKAFDGCDSLTKVTIPNGVINIGEKAFSSCDSLQYNIYDNVKYLGNDDNEYMCLIGADDNTATTHTINAKCKIIAEKAFQYSNFSEITLPNSIRNIGNYAFFYCSLKSITIPYNVESIGDYAFSGCRDLQNITIPKSVTSIGYEAFDRDTSLSKIYYTGTMDNWVQIDFESPASNPIYYAKNLYVNGVLVKDVILTTATEISNHAFNSFNSLYSITIPDSVTKIGEYAFYDCNNLQSIAIPDSVTNIGEYAFSDCDSLTDIYCEAESQSWSGDYWLGDCIATLHWGYKGQ